MTSPIPPSFPRRSREWLQFNADPTTWALVDSHHLQWDVLRIHAARCGRMFVVGRAVRT